MFRKKLIYDRFVISVFAGCISNSHWRFIEVKYIQYAMLYFPAVVRPQGLRIIKIGFKLILKTQSKFGLKITKIQKI